MTYGNIGKEDCEPGSEPIEIRIGDVANVVGQSVSMTVSGFSNNSVEVYCVWFDTRDRLLRAAFPPAILELEARR